MSAFFTNKTKNFTNKAESHLIVNFSAHSIYKFESGILKFDL